VCQSLVRPQRSLSHGHAVRRHPHNKNIEWTFFPAAATLA
jgi:hypothetical protein